MFLYICRTPTKSFKVSTASVLNGNMVVARVRDGFAANGGGRARGGAHPAGNQIYIDTVYNIVVCVRIYIYMCVWRTMFSNKRLIVKRRHSEWFFTA